MDFAPPQRAAGADTAAASASTSSQPIAPPSEQPAAPQVSATVATLQRKVKKVLDIRPEQLHNDLWTLSEEVGLAENSIHTRRNLRLNVEFQRLELYQDFVTKFQPVERLLLNLDEGLDSLETSLETALSSVKSTQMKTKQVMEQSASLREKQRVAITKKKIAQSFLAKFRLSEDDLDIIRCTENRIDAAFFTALEKVEAIRRNCRVFMLSVPGGGADPNSSGGNLAGMMMMGATGRAAAADLGAGGGDGMLNQTSAYDILQETAEIMDVAFERLFVAVQQQCRRLATGTGGAPGLIEAEGREAAAGVGALDGENGGGASLARMPAGTSGLTGRGAVALFVD